MSQGGAIRVKLGYSQLIALFNLSVLGFSFVLHDKANRTQQGNLLGYSRIRGGASAPVCLRRLKWIGQIWFIVGCVDMWLQHTYMCLAGGWCLDGYGHCLMCGLPIWICGIMTKQCSADWICGEVVQADISGVAGQVMLVDRWRVVELSRRCSKLSGTDSSHQLCLVLCLYHFVVHV